MKCSGLIMIKNVYNLYTGSYGKLLSQINEDLNKLMKTNILLYMAWKTHYCGMPLLPKLIY